MFAWSNVGTNLPRYLSWFTETQTVWPLLGAVALLIPVRPLWPSVPDWRLVLLLGVCVLALWLHYFVYLAFEDWLFLRFLLPSWPLLMLGFAVLLGVLLRWTGTWAPLIGAAVTLVVCVHTLEIARARGAFDSWIRDREAVAISKTIAAELPPQSVYFTMQHSGSLRYYAGRLTLRYDQLEPEWLDRGVEWLRGRGVASYALLDEWEVPEFRRRFPGQSAIERLETPLWEFRGLRQFTWRRTWHHRRPPIESAIDRSDVFTRMHRCDPPMPLTVPFPPSLTRYFLTVRLKLSRAFSAAGKTLAAKAVGSCVCSTNATSSLMPTIMMPRMFAGGWPGPNTPEPDHSILMPGTPPTSCSEDFWIQSVRR